ncbi:peptidylprolyl isomerase [Candidatus Pelagibacter sp. HIMB1495]|uniref:peptidylprolyl isomerase n=1 Tax=unclassified Candidatus Pelagibacter TaxID=2647897 RepID=UPI003F85C34E
MYLYNKIILAIFFYLIVLVNELKANENRILIKVNNEIITSIDIFDEINYLSLINKNFEKLENKQQIQIARKSIIRQKIKKIEIKKFKNNILLNDELFEKLIKNNYKNLRFKNLSDFEIILKENNLNFEFIRNKITIETLWNRLIYQKYIKNVVIDENQIKKTIEKRKKQKEFLLSEIVFDVDENENIVEKFQIIEDTINKKNFSEAALKHSISDSSKNAGELGWIKENILSNNIKLKIQNLKIGQYTKPIVIPGGFLILKINDFKEIETKINLDQEVKNIVENKTNDQLGRFSNIYLNKLRKNVEINEL